MTSICHAGACRWNASGITSTIDDRGAAASNRTDPTDPTDPSDLTRLPPFQLGNPVSALHHEQSLAIALLLCVVSGCGHAPAHDAAARTKAPAPAAARKRIAPGPAVTDYVLKGVVRRVERETSHVRIRHEAIPGFMAAMEMPFALADPKELDAVRPGDLVEGVLRVERQDGAVVDYELFGLKVTRPAPARSKVIDFSSGKAVLRDGPRQLQVGEQVPDFAMTGQEGKGFRLADLRGKVVVLTFIYTRCPLPDFCPLMDRKFSNLAQRISTFPDRAFAVRLVSLSFDPEHDTPEVLAQHARIRGATPPLWIYAVATHDELAKVAPALGLLYAPGQGEIVHNLCTAIIDPEGRLARLELGRERNSWEPVDFLKTIYSLIPGS
jgi:protein SCO1/2